MINKCFVKIIGAVLCTALFVTGAGINVKAADTNKLTVSASERPDLPLIQITTEDGALPTYEVVNAPSGLAGATITDAEYVSGNMTISY